MILVVAQRSEGETYDKKQNCLHVLLSRTVFNILEEKNYMNFSDCGNTVSASIPITLTRAVQDGTSKSGMKVMLVGFGVGLSWGASIINW